MNSLRHLPRFLICAWLLLTCTSINGTVPKVFWAEIWQDGQRLPIKDETVQLARRPFQIRVIIRGNPYLYLSASLQKKYYGLKESEAVPELELLPYKSYADSRYNQDRMIYLAEETVHHLNWESVDGGYHRFDDPVKYSHQLVIGTRSVDKMVLLTDYGQHEEEMDFATLNQDVYLFLVATGPPRGYDEPAPDELARQKIRLRWN